MEQLPVATAVHVSYDRLAYNVDHYSTALQTLNLGEQAAVAMIRENLLAIPLTHASKASAHELQTEGIIPSGYPNSPGRRNNTSTLDRSLGLDEFTFMHWGAVARGNVYGPTVATIDAKTILESDKTIVTPHDVPSHTFFGRHTPYDQLKPSRQSKIQEYFDSVVTGRDWIDIVAVKALRHMQHFSRPAYQLTTQDELGEIKYASSIDPDMITGIIDSKISALRAQRDMVRRGFSPVSKVSLSAQESIATWQTILEEANRSQN